MANKRSSKSKKSSIKTKRKQVDQWIILSKIVEEDDNVIIHPLKRNVLPYIAKIKKIEVDTKNKYWVHIQWYYRPEDTKEGRRIFHGAKELFLSNHEEVQSADTILDKCKVHSLNDFVSLGLAAGQDYFCRFEYDAISGKFNPDKMQVHCICEMPYNPDDFMVQCQDEECKKWFHPECLEYTIEQAQAMNPFHCKKCLEKNSEDEDTTFAKCRAILTASWCNCKKRRSARSGFIWNAWIISLKKYGLPGFQESC